MTARSKRAPRRHRLGIAGVHLIALTLPQVGCGQANVSPQPPLPAPFNALTGVSLGMSVEDLQSSRPAIRGTPESGIAEDVGSLRVMYDFGGGFLPSGVFGPGSLERVLVTQDLDADDNPPSGRFNDVLGLGPSDLCAAVADSSLGASRTHRVWLRGEWLFSAVYIPSAVQLDRGKPIALPSRISLRWEKAADAPNGLTRVPCPDTP